MFIIQEKRKVVNKLRDREIKLAIFKQNSCT